MNDYRIRLIRSIANRLGAMIAGNGALYGVEAGLRGACEALVLQVSGARIEFRDHLPVAILADGYQIDTVGDHPGAETAIGVALNEWIGSGNPPRELSRALPLASGAEHITAAMAADIERLCALAYAFGSVTHEAACATLTIRGSGHRLHAIYAKGPVRWEDGVISAPSKPLPQSLRLALVGRPVSALLADEAIGDRLITRVIDADPRERVLRVHTADAGKFI